MLLDNFTPAINKDSAQVAPLNLSVTTSNQIAALPEGGIDLEFTNESAAGIAYIKFGKQGNGALAVTAATGCPILAGQSKIYRAPDGFNAIAYIGSTTVTLKVVPGKGT